MFHMLGRFVFISPFSRRSRPGFRMGSTWFGCCCCDRGLLNVFTISNTIHSLFAIQSCCLAYPLLDPSLTEPFPSDVPWHSYGSAPRLDRSVISSVVPSCP